MAQQSNPDKYPPSGEASSSNRESFPYTPRTIAEKEVDEISDFPFDKLLFDQTFWLVGNDVKKKQLKIDIQKHGGIISSSINIATRVIFLRPQDFTHMFKGLTELRVMLNSHKVCGKGIPLAEGWIHDSIIAGRPIATKPYLINDRNLFDVKFWERVGLGGGRAIDTKMKKRKCMGRGKIVNFDLPVDIEQKPHTSTLPRFPRSFDSYEPKPDTGHEATIDPVLLHLTATTATSSSERATTAAVFPSTMLDTTPATSCSSITEALDHVSAQTNHDKVHLARDHISQSIKVAPPLSIVHSSVSSGKDDLIMFSPTGSLASAMPNHHSQDVTALEYKKRKVDESDGDYEEEPDRKQAKSISKSALYNRRYRNQATVQPQDTEAFDAIVSHLQSMVANGGLPKGGMRAYLIGKGIHSLYTKYGSLIRAAVPGLPNSRDQLTKMTQGTNRKWQKFVDEQRSKVLQDV